MEHDNICRFGFCSCCNNSYNTLFYKKQFGNNIGSCTVNNSFWNQFYFSSFSFRHYTLFFFKEVRNMITAVWEIPGFLSYFIAITGILSTLYSGFHKNKYKISGKLLTYGACLFDVAAGIVSIKTESVIAQIILCTVELGLLITAFVIEIRSAQHQGFLFVLGRFIVGCVIGCVIVYLFAVINIILGVVGIAVIFFFFSFFDSDSTYFDPDNEFRFLDAYVDNEYCKVDNAYKEHFTGRNIIKFRNEKGSDYLEQAYEGSSSYHCKSDNSEYIRIGNSFIKK